MKPRIRIVVPMLITLALPLMAQKIGFRVPIRIETSLSHIDTLWIGIHGDGPGGSISDNTFGIDIDTGTPIFREWSETLCPPDPPNASLITKFVDAPGRTDILGLVSTGISPENFFGFFSLSQIDTFAFQIYGNHLDEGPITFSWPANLSSYGNQWTLKKINDLSFDLLVEDMTTMTTWVDSNKYRYYELNYLLILGGLVLQPDTVEYIHSTGWNLVSLPLALSDSSAPSVFPGLFGSAFEFVPGVGYTPAPDLRIGKGYWIYYQNTNSASNIGLPPSQVSVSGAPGWNLIGSADTPVQMADIQISGGNSIFGSLGYIFTPGTGYVPVTEIQPGQAAWIFIEGPAAECTITFL